MAESRIALAVCLAVLALLALPGCGWFESDAVEFAYSRPARYELPDHVDAIAVADLAGPDREDRPWGPRAAEILHDTLAESQGQEGVRLIGRSNALQEKIGSAQQAAQVASSIGADAVIIGSVDTSHAESEVVDPYIDEETGQVSRRKVWQMTASVTLRLRMISAADASSLLSMEITRSFDSTEQAQTGLVSRFAGLVQDTDQPPPVEEVLTELTRSCAAAFANRISAVRVEVQADLAAGPDSPEMQRANKLARKGQYKAALDLYRAQLGIHPEHPGLLYNLGLMLEATGQWDQAAEMYRTAASLSDRTAYRQALSRVER
jgi:hypothetical protein